MGVTHSASHSDLEGEYELARTAVAFMVAGIKNTLCTAFFDGIEGKRRFFRMARAYQSL